MKGAFIYYLNITNSKVTDQHAHPLEAKTLISLSESNGPNVCPETMALMSPSGSNESNASILSNGSNASILKQCPEAIALMSLSGSNGPNLSILKQWP